MLPVRNKRRLEAEDRPAFFHHLGQRPVINVADRAKTTVHRHNWVLI